MAWSALPCTSKTTATLEALYDEVRGAIVERQTEVGGSAPTNVAAGDANLASVLNDYRDKIETLIPNFRRVEDGGVGEAYTVAQCLTDALGSATWDNDPLSNASRHALEASIWNDMRLVLNKLRWLAVSVNGTFTNQKMDPTYAGSNVSWDASWAAAKSAYSGASYIAYTSAIACGFVVRALSPYSGYTYYHNINHWRAYSFSFDVPSYTANVSDSKMRLPCAYYDDGGSGAGNIDLYEAAAFGGTPVSVAVSSTGPKVADITNVTKGSTEYYSMETNPTSPTPDSYRTSEGSSDTRRGFELYTPVLLVELDFSYQ